jgi:hypothetical protein
MGKNGWQIGSKSDEIHRFNVNRNWMIVNLECPRVVQLYGMSGKTRGNQLVQG